MGEQINVVEEAHKINKLADTFLNGAWENQGNAALAMFDEIHKIRDAGGMALAKQVFDEARKDVKTDTQSNVSAQWTERDDHKGAAINFQQTGLFKSYANITMAIRDDGRTAVRAGVGHRGSELFFGDSMK
jgi:hypothetical protein